MSHSYARCGPAALAALALAGSALGAEVSGVVREAGSLAPVPGALVTLQATTVRTTTGADGAFALDVPAASGLKIVAAKKGFFNQSIVVDAPLAGAEILLQAVLQQDDPGYALLPPEECGSCHPSQLDEWTGSAMANAGLNTWVLDIYDGTGTPGGAGGFVYTRDSIFAETNPNSECAPCHQPEVWLARPGAAIVGLEEPIPPVVLHGISCEACHKVADVNVENINYPGLFNDEVAIFTRPSDVFANQVQYGVFGDSDFHAFGLMRASYQPQLVAELCGLCHQDKNDLEQDHEFDDVTSEPTYIEWVESAYGDPASPQYATCVDCHMPPTGASTVCVSDPLRRDPETIHSHEVRGTTPEFLENAVELALTTHVVGGQLHVQVEVNNSLTGHHVPTGVTVRNMILLVEAWREGSDPLLDPLTYVGSQVVHPLGGVGDPSLGYYAGLPGKFFAKVNHDALGNSPTFFTDATGIVFDNRIPALQADLSDYAFVLPAEEGPVHVRARLVYRRAFRALVDAKQWTADGHGNPLGDVAPPHYGHLMEEAGGVVVVGAATGACCHGDGSCSPEPDAASCNGEFFGPGTVCGPTTCGDACGNTVIDPGEECDDGNVEPLDGCDAECRLEEEPVPATPPRGAAFLALLLMALGALAARPRRSGRTG